MTRSDKDFVARLKSLEDAHGFLERRYAADILLVPRIIRVEGDRLVWAVRTRPDRAKAFERALRNRSRADAARAQWNTRRVQPGGDTLRAFAGLVGAPPSRVLAFARRWGPLGICPCGLPSSHSLDCAPRGWDGHGGWEPLTRWDYYARRARAVLFVASELRGGGKIPNEELMPLHLDLAKVLLVAGRLQRPRVLPPDQWSLLINVVNEWIEVGGVRPRLILSGDAVRGRPELVLTPTWRFPQPEFSLFGTLGMQLAFAVSGARGLAFCSSCGQWFEPGSQLRRGKQHYCSDCATRGKWRRASAAYRSRQKEKAPTMRSQRAPQK